MEDHIENHDLPMIENGTGITWWCDSSDRGSYRMSSWPPDKKAIHPWSVVNDFIWMGMRNYATDSSGLRLLSTSILWNFIPGDVVAQRDYSHALIVYRKYDYDGNGVTSWDELHVCAHSLNHFDVRLNTLYSFAHACEYFETVGFKNPYTEPGRDDDDDNIWTQYENPDPNGNGDPSDAVDTEGDGISDYLDYDDDDDIVPTKNENPDPNSDGNPSDAFDSDLDGIPDYLDYMAISPFTAHIAYWRPSDKTWNIYNIGSQHHGEAADIPVPADYDGDGEVDIAVWKPANGIWDIKGIGMYLWGTEGDIPVPADYDGDGDDDIVVWRPSNGRWYFKDSVGINWGTEGDIPVPADYDGDGDDDIVVWRPSNGRWYIKDLGGILWGIAGDVPIPANWDNTILPQSFMFIPVKEKINASNSLGIKKKVVKGRK